MYCINCGVKLADTEQQCPLCGTVPYHPELSREAAERPYPEQKYPTQQVSHTGALVVLTTAFLLPVVITLLCDLQINGGVVWSGFVVGALLLAYVILVLPMWFKKPSAAVLVPCDFAAIGLYLLYISVKTEGGWFLPFAFPLVGFLGLLVTAVVVLLRYVRRGRLYIFGGAAIALGAFMPLLEYLSYLTFHRPNFAVWSYYPLTVLVLLGGMLIFLAVCRPARETMERKFFL